ncbi:hypothetical protein TWF696_001638 [Orbilia brochopaga]|uniref:Uncharacterized protein n=1 Tax=Orbilia brochopaga TaxID=3140254 RepID=A0AAV9U9I6_9PEZI
MLYLNCFVIAITALSQLAFPTLAAVSSGLESTPPGDVSIGNIVYGGTGCPQGSAQVWLQDKQSFAAHFRQFTAYINTDTNNVADSRKFCQLNLAVNAPSGWQFSIIQTDFAGYASLSANIEATHTNVVYFSGRTDDQVYSRSIRGPTYQDYNIRGTVGEYWSSCGNQALLNIKTILELNGQGYGAIREERGSGRLRQIYGLRWRPC